MDNTFKEEINIADALDALWKDSNETFLERSNLIEIVFENDEKKYMRTDCRYDTPGEHCEAIEDFYGNVDIKTLSERSYLVKELS